MPPLQLLAIVLGLAVTAVGVALLVRAVMRIVAVVRQGRAAVGRFDDPAQRTKTMLYEVFAHPRMLRKKWVAVAHWFTMISFGMLFLTLVNAYGQLFDARFALPLIGHFPPFEWLTEFFAWTGLFGIVYLIWLRQRTKPSVAAREKGNERRSRFWGSTFWQAYCVEFTILAVVLCILALRALEFALGRVDGEHHASALHFPLTAWMGQALTGLSAATLAGAIIAVALLKILVSMAWMITIGLQPTMGVAWHRFLAFFNIWFKRHADGRTSLGELQPMMVKGKPLTDMEQLEELYADEEEDGTEGAAEPSLGVGRIEDFTWKGLLDFTTCTECGRCQEQCPAWNTDKPLSPKMLVMNLRDAAYAQAPWQTATQPAGTGEGADGSGATPMTGTPEDFDIRQLVGPTEGDPTRPTGGAVIDPDVLWSCTSCGACVEQCPVDIEHVDAIVDMRRNQVLIESAFPSELGGLFKNLESKQNPWGMANSTRMDWAKDLDFEVKQVGADVESLSEVEYLFWVGCAGAFEDRAKKTTQAVAELLNIAGVDFAVLGDGEACTGDSARRAGNEVLYQMLAQQNVEMLNEVGATKIVVTCAHCFNTIKNEYPQNGGKYEVVHHTQLLNRLVREKRLQPVAASEVAEPSKVASSAPSVTYHDPCYLGRHNQVYEAPRELIATLPGVEYREMERSKEKSFCCGAGGARMWMEEKLGSRINVNRTEEAIATGAERIAIGCPFCRVMMSDGLTAAQEEGRGKDVEVVDVAQMLLAGVRRGQAADGGAVATPGETREGTADEDVAAAATQRITLPGDLSGPGQAGAAAAGAAAAAGEGAATSDEGRTSDGDDTEGPTGTRVDEEDAVPEAEATVDQDGATGPTTEQSEAGQVDAGGTCAAVAAGAGVAPAAFAGQRIGADAALRLGWAGTGAEGTTPVAGRAQTPEDAQAAPVETGAKAGTEATQAAAPATPAEGTVQESAPAGEGTTTAPAETAQQRPQTAAPAAGFPAGSGTAPAAFTGQRIGGDAALRMGWAAPGSPATTGGTAASEQPAAAGTAGTEPTPAREEQPVVDTDAASAATPATETPERPQGGQPATAPGAHAGSRIGSESTTRFGWAEGRTAEGGAGEATVSSTGVMGGSAVDDAAAAQTPDSAEDREPQEVVETPAAQPAAEEAPVPEEQATPVADSSQPVSEPSPTADRGPVAVPNVGERAPRIGSGSPALRLGAWKG